MLALLKGAGSVEAEELATERIRVDGGTQMRAGLNAQTLAEYKESWLAGARFPAVVVYFDGTEYWLGDGFHRVASHKEAFGALAEKPGIACEVRAGTRRDAVLHAVGANAEHGLRRTDDDKQRAVDALLRDEEWGQWADREIARRCNVSPTFVGKRRAALGQAEPATERTYVTRHGTVATMAVENIGSRQPLTVEEVKALILSSVPAEAKVGPWLRVHQAMIHYRGLVPAGRDLQIKVFSVAMTNLLAETEAKAQADDKREERIDKLRSWLMGKGWAFSIGAGPKRSGVYRNGHSFYWDDDGSDEHWAALRDAQAIQVAAQKPQNEPGTHETAETGVIAPESEETGQNETVASVGEEAAGPREITEELDAAIRRAVCAHVGDRAKWEALAATGADHGEIADLLKECINSTGGGGGPGLHYIQVKRGPFVTIFEKPGGPVLHHLFAGRLVDAVRKAWGIPLGRRRDAPNAITSVQAVELVWAALDAEHFRAPILPGKIQFLKTAPMAVYKQFIRPGETVTDETLLMALGKVEASLEQAMGNCDHAQSDRDDFCSRCGQMAKPFAHSAAAAPNEPVTVHVDSEGAGRAPMAAYRSSLDRGLNGTAPERAFVAQMVHKTLSMLLEAELEAYSKLTGRHTDVLPVRRGLEAMREELTALLNVLQPSQEPKP
jgi:hypothetical protein